MEKEGGYEWPRPVWGNMLDAPDPLSYGLEHVTLELESGGVVVVVVVAVWVFVT